MPKPSVVGLSIPVAQTSERQQYLRPHSGRSNKVLIRQALQLPGAFSSRSTYPTPNYRVAHYYELPHTLLRQARIHTDITLDNSIIALWTDVEDAVAAIATTIGGGTTIDVATAEMRGETTEEKIEETTEGKI